VIWGALCAVLSAAYYFKIIRAMYLQTSEEEVHLELSIHERIVLGIASFFTLAIGLAPQFFLERLQAWVLR